MHDLENDQVKFQKNIFSLTSRKTKPDDKFSDLTLPSVSVAESESAVSTIQQMGSAVVKVQSVTPTVPS